MLIGLGSRGASALRSALCWQPVLAHASSHRWVGGRGGQEAQRGKGNGWGKGGNKPQRGKGNGWEGALEKGAVRASTRERQQAVVLAVKQLAHASGCDRRRQEVGQGARAAVEVGYA